MTNFDRQRQRIIYHFVRLLAFSAIIVPVFFAGRTNNWNGSLLSNAWPVYVTCVITIGCFFALSAQWNILDRKEIAEARSEVEAEAALANLSRD